MSRWIIATTVVLVAIAAASYAYFQTRPPALPTAAEGRDLRGPAAPVRQTVAALGRIRPAGGITNVGGTTGMRVAEVLVAPGEVVSPGQPLARMQDYSLRQQELALAEQALREGHDRLAAERRYGEAAVQQAQVALQQAELQAGEVAASEERIQLLRSNARVAESNLQRVEGLSERVVSRQEREQLQLAVDQARDAVQQAESQLQHARAAQQLAVRNAQAQLAAAEANLARVDATVSLESLQARIDMARQALEQSTIRAPIAGTVLDVTVRTGEIVGQQPIAQLANLDQMEVVAEVYETDIGLVEIGQRATIRSAALAGPVEGTVTRISSMIAPNQIIGLDPAARADVRVVPVTVRVDRPELVARRVNLQVDVTIDIAGQTQRAAANGDN